MRLNKQKLLEESRKLAETKASDTESLKTAARAASLVLEGIARSLEEEPETPSNPYEGVDTSFG